MHVKNMVYRMNKRAVNKISCSFNILKGKIKWKLMKQYQKK